MNAALNLAILVAILIVFGIAFVAMLYIFVRTLKVLSEIVVFIGQNAVAFAESRDAARSYAAARAAKRGDAQTEGPGEELQESEEADYYRAIIEGREESAGVGGPSDAAHPSRRNGKPWHPPQQREGVGETYDSEVEAPPIREGGHYALEEEEKPQR